MGNLVGEDSICSGEAWQQALRERGELMCPMCFATVAWIAAGISSTGGISALVVSRFRGKNNFNLRNKGERNEPGSRSDYEDATDRVA
jgi:hypothetical protein